MKCRTRAWLAFLAVVVPCGVGLTRCAGAPAEAADNAPIVKLLHAGNDPKQRLRLTANVGLERTIVMITQTDVEMSMGDNKMPAFKSPPIRLSMDLKVTKVSPAGDIRYEFKYNKPELIEDPQAMPAVVQAMKNSLRGLEGMNGYAVISNRGVTEEAEIAIPPDINPQLKQFMGGIKQSLQHLSTPWPEESVGVGAKWEITMKLNQNGIVLKQSSVHTLTALDNNIAKLALKIEQTAERQKVQGPGVAPNSEVELLALNSTGSGDMEFDLARLVPSRASVSIHSTSRMTVESAGQKNEMGMKLGMTMKMEGK